MCGAVIAGHVFYTAFVGDKLSGADIMLGFVINTVVEQLVTGERFPNIHAIHSG